MSDQVWVVAGSHGECEGYFRSREDAYASVVLTFGQPNVSEMVLHIGGFYKCDVTHQFRNVHENPYTYRIERLYVNDGPVNLNDWEHV